MTLTVPQHIADSGLLTNSVKYKWDDPWECQFEVPRLDNQIGPLYARTVMAFAVATAEWVVWQQSGASNDPLFLDFIEACWASVVDRRYLRHISCEFGRRIKGHYSISTGAPSTDDLWGPGELQDRVRGPQFVAIHLLGHVADRTAPNDNGSMEAVYLCNLAEQMTKKSTAYKNWRRDILDRMQTHYCLPEEEENWLGPPIPREALSPQLAYRPDMAESLVRTFLKSLDPAKNKFLTPPAEMLQLGFKGLPYDI